MGKSTTFTCPITSFPDITAPLGSIRTAFTFLTWMGSPSVVTTVEPEGSVSVPVALTRMLRVRE